MASDHPLSEIRGQQKAEDGYCGKGKKRKAPFSRGLPADARQYQEQQGEYAGEKNGKEEDQELQAVSRGSPQKKKEQGVSFSEGAGTRGRKEQQEDARACCGEKGAEIGRGPGEISSGIPEQLRACHGKKDVKIDPQ